MPMTAASEILFLKVGIIGNILRCVFRHAYLNQLMAECQTLLKLQAGICCDAGFYYMATHGFSQMSMA